MSDSTASKKSVDEQACLSNEYPEFMKYYRPIFNGKKCVADIIDAYIGNTNQNALFNDLNLRYLGFYLFAVKLTEEQWDNKTLGNMVKNKTQ